MYVLEGGDRQPGRGGAACGTRAGPSRFPRSAAVIRIQTW